jgi:hypothetical protein
VSTTKLYTCRGCGELFALDADGTIADHDHPDRGWAELGCPGADYPPVDEDERDREVAAIEQARWLAATGRLWRLS